MSGENPNGRPKRILLVEEAARIVAGADVYDRLVHRRGYRADVSWTRREGGKPTDECVAHDLH
jgi:hypothetical protein